MTNRHRLAALTSVLLALYGLSSVAYSVTEGKSLWDALWWAFMTLTTVGYGDQYPHSVLGHAFGIALVFTAVFIVLPTITAVVASRFIVNEDAWTHAEQEEVKDLLRKIHERLGE